MTKQKKDWVAFNIRADRKTMDRFNAYCEEVGQTKTTAWERIVNAYLDEFYDKENKEKKRK